MSQNTTRNPKERFRMLIKSVLTFHSHDKSYQISVQIFLCHLFQWRNFEPCRLRSVYYFSKILNAHLVFFLVFTCSWLSINARISSSETAPPNLLVSSICSISGTGGNFTSKFASISSSSVSNGVSYFVIVCVRDMPSKSSKTSCFFSISSHICESVLSSMSSSSNSCSNKSKLSSLLSVIPPLYILELLYSETAHLTMIQGIGTSTRLGGVT